MKHEFLNILFVGLLPPHEGGASISSSLILETLVELGHGVQAIAPVLEGTEEKASNYALNNPAIHIVRYALPFFEKEVYRSGNPEYQKLEAHELINCFSRCIKRCKPDVIFLGRESFLTTLPKMASDLGVPVVLRVAGGTLSGMKMGNFTREEQHQFIANLHKVASIVCPAQHMVPTLAAMKVHHTVNIPHAVELQKFIQPIDRPVLRNRLGLKTKECLIVHISNLKSIKRPLDFIQAAKRVLDQRRDVKFLVIGNGPSREEMEDFCNEVGMAQQVGFLGWIDYADMVKYYQAADVVVMMSEAEGLARVYLETLAAGRCLVSSDILPAREVIEHDKTGLLYRKGDVDDLAQKMLLAVEDTDLRNACAKAGQNVVKKNDHRTVAKAYINLFQELKSDA